jgi:hypothetical protein
MSVSVHSLLLNKIEKELQFWAKCPHSQEEVLLFQNEGMGWERKWLLKKGKDKVYLRQYFYPPKKDITIAIDLSGLDFCLKVYACLKIINEEEEE